VPRWLFLQNYRVKELSESVHIIKGQSMLQFKSGRSVSAFIAIASSGRTEQKLLTILFFGLMVYTL
jgi:hypothetical protein